MSSRFPCKIRFGCKPNLPGLGSATVVISKIDAYGAVGMHVAFGRVRRKISPTGLGKK